ncbi:MAG: PAS domain S-box protein [Methanomicrobiales archaeon]|nr:PAS domain S-box protein [Methanomicrobiales archaeon]
MISTRRRLAAILLIVLFCGAAVCFWTATQEDRHMRNQLLTQAQFAAVGIVSDQVTALEGSDADLLRPEYTALKSQMTRLRASDPRLRFAYLIGKHPDGTYFFYVDSEPAGSPDYSPPGQPYPEVTAPEQVSYTTGTALVEGPEPDRWGIWVSGLIPLTDPETGEIIGLFGIDVDARDWFLLVFIACLPPLTATFLVVLLVLTFYFNQQRAERIRRQTFLFVTTQQALLDLAKLPFQTMDQFLQNLALINARTLGADRVSIWMFSDDYSELACRECYTLSDNSHTSGMHIMREEYPRYFTALANDRIIAAERAREDERTSEFLETYLIPLGIVSLMDVPIRRNGQLVGIICHEFIGEERSFDPLEQDFAASAADHIASALERDLRIAAEKALVESERRYREVVEDQTELINRFSADFTTLFVNRAYCRFFRTNPEELIGKKLPAFVHEEDISRFMLLLKSLTPSSPVADITHRVMLDDGSERWLSWIIRAVFSEDGRVIEYQAVGRDISWQKQMEETLSMTNSKLSLLSNITRHDVINQIIILKGFLHLASACRNEPEKFAHYTEKINRAIATIEAQINFTKTYQDMGSIAPSWQDVGLCIIRAKGGLPAADIRTELHKPGLEVFADPLLEKVFYNLFDNAIRYGAKNEITIRVTSEERPEGLVITCEDNGEGIAPADKSRLFTQGFGKNTGFGLFLSREILAVSGISIQETGAPGSGARFEIIVPRRSFRFRQNGQTDSRANGHRNGFS